MNDSNIGDLDIFDLKCNIFFLRIFINLLMSNTQ